MPIHLENRDLLNTQQMEVAVNGPDGATHLILCTGVASLGCLLHETYTFFVGPEISRRQFVGAIAAGGLSTIQASESTPSGEGYGIQLRADLVPQQDKDVG